jgi:phosphonate transport system permease protein
VKTAIPYILPSARYRKKVTLVTGVVAACVIACVYLGFDPWILFTDFHYAAELVGSMLPPNLSLLWSSKAIPISVAETISMALLGTLFGGATAVLMAFLAAANTMPLRLVRTVVRAILSLLRVIPSLVFILVFVIAVGLGSFAGMLTLLVSTIGTFGQLFTEIIENTERAPAEACLKFCPLSLPIFCTPLT